MVMLLLLLLFDVLGRFSHMRLDVRMSRRTSEQFYWASVSGAVLFSNARASERHRSGVLSDRVL